LKIIHTPSASQTPLSRGDFEGMAITNPLLRECCKKLFSKKKDKKGDKSQVNPPLKNYPLPILMTKVVNRRGEEKLKC